MMNYKTNHKDMESYLLDEMNYTEKLKFELKIDKDPILQTDLEIQRATIEALQEVRKQEFKARFEEVTLNSGTSLMIKRTLITVGLSLVMVIAILLFQANDKTNTAEYKKAEIQQADLESVHESKAKEKWENSESDNKQESPKLQSLMTEENAEIIASSDNAILQKTASSISEFKLLAEDEKEENDLGNKMLRTSPKESTLTNKTTNTEDYPKTLLNPVPTPKIGTFNTKENTIESQEAEFEDKPVLSYQFYGGNIFLYPDDEEKSHTYQQLDLHNKKTGETEYYIYYKETYYQLYENQTFTVPAQKITDRKSLKKLNAVKERKNLEKMKSMQY